MTKGAKKAWVVEGLAGVEVGVLSIAIEPETWPESLTDSERDVARRILRDQSQAEIAEARGTTVSTVASQVASIFDKLEVSSASELVFVLARM